MHTGSIVEDRVSMHKITTKKRLCIMQVTLINNSRLLVHCSALVLKVALNAYSRIVLKIGGKLRSIATGQASTHINDILPFLATMSKDTMGTSKFFLGNMTQCMICTQEHFCQTPVV